MNTKGFTGKAQAYAAARPGYPDEAIDYIRSLVPPNAVFADIGAGTGKFTEFIARCGYEVIAVEPNADMREQLAVTLAPFPNVTIINSTAESTPLPDHTIDVITCSQSLGWLDLNAFREECHRIGKPGVIVISLFNKSYGDNHTLKSHRFSSEQASDLFFVNPVIRKFPNPVLYTRERWIQSKISISDSPRPSDPGYNEFIAEANAIFDRDSVDGYLHTNFVTTVYSERI